MFSDLSLKSPFAKYSVSSSATLLVCKAWLRVATPLLYSVVVIRSKAQCRALGDALQKNPDLGRFIKKLRAEGGFGAHMQHILKFAPNITDLFVSLQIPSSDSCAGLVAGLPLINPTRLIIFDDPDNLWKNKAALQLMAALQGCRTKWTNTNTLLLPYRIIPFARESFVLAVCAFPGIKTVSFPIFFPDTVIREIAAIPTIEAIEIRFKPRKSVPLPTPADMRVNSLLRWAEDSDAPSRKRVYKLSARLPADPTFRPLMAIPQPIADKIWSRILFFAMLDLKPRPKNQTQHMKGVKERLATTKRLRFLLVSKLFHRLALPYLYREPALGRRRVSRFTECVLATPTLGAHIRELDIKFLARAIPYMPRLSRLLGDSRMRFPYAGLCALAESCGATLVELSGMSFTRGDATDRSPAFFSRFTALRTLSWAVISSPINNWDPFFTSVDAVPTDALPALEFLTLKSTEGLSVFPQMELPNLRRVSIFVHDKPAPAQFGAPAALTPIVDFLRAHGAKIWTLRTETPIFHSVHVLTLCPNISTFVCRVDTSRNYDLGASGLEVEFRHDFLSTLLVNRVPGVHVNKRRAEQVWAEIFPQLETALVHLPALREIRALPCEWPTTEHAIAKSVWVQAAERLLEKGIKLTDKGGAEWHPRLKLKR
ncbi:hypothetical protein B0H14DRAFT_3743191 [Mycena olivaceomarginata]|nr:hypothetical protein B0H14DRAFT_3743191 [Mycena olivaceomarginata]